MLQYTIPVLNIVSIVYCMLRYTMLVLSQEKEVDSIEGLAVGLCWDSRLKAMDSRAAKSSSIEFVERQVDSRTANGYITYPRPSCICSLTLDLAASLLRNGTARVLFFFKGLSPSTAFGCCRSLVSSTTRLRGLAGSSRALRSMFLISFGYSDLQT